METGEVDLELRALTQLGLAQVGLGRIDEGLAHIDEAIAAAVSGEAATLVESGLSQAISQKRVTYDLARQMEGATEQHIPSPRIGSGQAVAAAAPFSK